MIPVHLMFPENKEVAQLGAVFFLLPLSMQDNNKDILSTHYKTLRLMKNAWPLVHFPLKMSERTLITGKRPVICYNC